MSKMEESMFNRSLWKKGDSSAKEFNPEEILRAQCEFLRDDTAGAIIPDLQIEEQTKQRAFAPPAEPEFDPYGLGVGMASQIAANLKFQKVKRPEGILDERCKVIANTLGDKADPRPIRRIELILNVPAMDNYSHRILIAEHLKIGLPIVVSSPALEFFQECNSIKEFHQALIGTLGSDKMALVIKALMLEVDKVRSIRRGPTAPERLKKPNKPPRKKDASE
jgi:hypothetical protein